MQLKCQLTPILTSAFFCLHIAFSVLFRVSSPVSFNVHMPSAIMLLSPGHRSTTEYAGPDCCDSCHRSWAKSAPFSRGWTATSPQTPDRSLRDYRLSSLGFVRAKNLMRSVKHLNCESVKKPPDFRTCLCARLLSQNREISFHSSDRLHSAPAHDCQATRYRQPLPFPHST